jgi:hypothetical protein
MTAEAAMEAARRAIAANADPTLREPIGLLQRAADLGSGEALARLAYLVALGVHAPPDWDRAVAMLREAAGRDWAPARAELAVLSDASGQIDIRALVAPRPMQLVHAAQRIGLGRSFFTPDECGWLVGRAAGRLERATVHDPQLARSIVVDERSNSYLPFTAFETDLALIFLRMRIAHSVRAPLPCLEPANVLHYAVGQEFAPHYDYFDPATPGHATDLATRGQRTGTFLVALNDGYEGGATAFPRLGWRWKGRAGDALFFANVGPDGSVDPTTLHAGMPVTGGEKWLLSQWIRDRPQA